MHYLRARGVAENTVHMYLSNFRAICNKARKQGVKVGKDNPFADLDIRRRETVKRALSKEEIALIASVNLRRHPRLEQARDLFMFSFYCRGMSFVDVIHLRNDWVVRIRSFMHAAKPGNGCRWGCCLICKRLSKNTGRTARIFFLISTPVLQDPFIRSIAMLWG